MTPLTTSKIDVPRSKSSENREIRAENARIRIKSVKKHTLDVLSGHSTAQYAAEAAGVAWRHIYRLATGLFKPHHVVFNDLPFDDSAESFEIGATDRKTT